VAGGLVLPDLLAAHQARRPVTAAMLALAREAWAAFRSPDPTAIEAVLAAGTDPLPALASALTRHLEQFPATADGLGRTERAALQAVASGLTGFVDVFVAHSQDEERPFMGDTTLRTYLERLARGPAPLLRIDADGRYHLTPVGAAVLDGRADQVELNGVDRWLGGVRLRGRAPWRWDRATRRLHVTG
jgi:hypothetical protein